MTRWLLDTGPVVAFFDRGDALHSWAVDQWASAPVPLFTCEAVLAEATYILAEHAGLPSDRVLALVERGAVSVPFHLGDHVGPIARLLAKYHDQHMQLADACIVRMSELYRDCRVFTLNRRDFAVYRRFGRQSIPLVVPP